MKPFSFTRESLTEIRRLARDGRSPQQICAALNIAIGQLKRICDSHNIEVRGAWIQPATFRIDFSGPAPRSLVAEAVRRGTTAQALAERIIETISEDDLFAAVLDN